MVDLLAASSRIELREYGEAKIIKRDQLDVRKLVEANARWTRALGLSRDPVRVEDLGDGQVRLRAEGVAGIVRVGDVDIEIAPKFLVQAAGSWQTVLWRILSAAHGGHLDESFTTAHRVDSLALPDLLAEMFLASYSKGAARGLPRAYQSHRDAGLVLRGALDTSRVGDWHARPWQVPYTTDLLVDDTALARLLRWTAEQLSEMVESAVRSRAAREVAARLSHVGRRPPQLVDARRIELGVQHRGLEAALLVGLILSEGSGIHHAAGEHALSGFLWNSDVIYENYVFWLCHRAARKRGLRVEKRAAGFGQLVAGRGKRLLTTPDVVFLDGAGTAVAVTDAKYKRFAARPQAADTYQVVTAAHVLGCQRVSLTYPVEDDGDKTVWRIVSTLGARDIEMTALPLNLMLLAGPGGAEALVNRLTNWLDGRLFDAQP